MAKKIAITFPRTNSQIKREMLANVAEFEKLAADMTEKFKNLCQKEFESKCGCSTCNGRGWVVVWDTCDSMSGCYAEFGGCPNKDCTKETRTNSGLNAAVYSKYDNNRGISYPFMKTTYYTMIEPILNSAHALKIQADEVRTYPRKGDEVCVVKGRKVPVGSVGRLFWVADQRYNASCGIKVGIQPAIGEPLWTYIENCEIIAT